MTTMKTADKVVVTLRVTEMKQEHHAERDGYCEERHQSSRHAPRDEFEAETSRSEG